MSSPEYNKRYRQERKKAGMCGSCFTRPSCPGKTQCERCSEMRRQRERANYRAGLCICGQPRDGKAKCPACAERHKAWMSVPENRNRWGEQVNVSNRLRRIRVLMHYGGKCACCGETGMPFLTLDHINNDGKKDRKYMVGSYWFRWIVKNGYPKDLQVLCWNCNMSKSRYGSGVCPHKILTPSIEQALDP